MKVLILGASTKTNRYSFLALNDLVDYGHDVIAVGRRGGDVRNIQIEKDLPEEADIDNVTVYLSEQNQEKYSEYLLNLVPRRVIFNPGAENPNLSKQLMNKGVEVLNACTLVMLRTNQF